MSETVPPPPPAPVPPPPAPPTPPPAEKVFTEDYVRRIRAEAENHRTEAQKAKEAAEAAERAASEKIAEASAAAERRIVTAELRAEAIKAGMVDLDGLKLLDIEKAGVKLNAAGDVEGAAEALAKMKEAKPYLFGQQRTGNTDRPPPGNPTPKKATEMTDDEWRAEMKRLGM